ncbi:unnamed protein product [Mytilus coruscus]|uniref:HAT C-terminal dimerisation domain-containing protein n=1 Tax=Mytilus coruscus TaxID=42192 RepID=A0A6J8CJB7_MYTCO|nr:unnamed protein product [Mytilus coruscus]
MNLKLKSIRAGHRSAVSRIYKKFDEIRESGTELVDSDELSNILDTLKRKQELLRKLDEDIIQDLDQEDIETEIVDSDEYSFNLETKVRQIAKFITVQTSTLNTNATSFTNSRNDVPPSYPITMPVTTSTTERSFSALRRLKIYLRSTMVQDRLSSLALIHVHREMDIDTERVLRSFALAKNRYIDFGY